MKKVNVFYIILVVLAVLMTAAVLIKDVSHASLTGGEEEKVSVRVDTVYRDTLYITQIVHDTIYVEKGAPQTVNPMDQFLLDLRQILKEDLSPFYTEYRELTKENIEEGKARFEECEKNAKKRYDALVSDFIKDYPEDLDYINNLVSKELTHAIKPYLHMLNEYGNRK